MKIVFLNPVFLFGKLLEEKIPMISFLIFIIKLFTLFVIEKINLNQTIM